MIIEDAEFGEVRVRRNALARRASFRVDNSGRLAVTVPTAVSDRRILRILKDNRKLIREKVAPPDPATQRTRDYQKKMLTKAAREYLPYRLEYWARRYKYNYARYKLMHDETAWGSCSTKGTISLNIGLMNVPEKLRDYVILHELAHLNHPDHSRAFWSEVAEHDKYYREHREKLKKFSPAVWDRK